MQMRMVRKWVFRLALALLAVVLVYVAILGFPAPLFAHAGSYGDYRVYSDEPFTDRLVEVFEDAARRVEAMEHDPPSGSQRVYLCHSPKRYAFFAFLTRKSPQSLAIGLSFFNETFVYMDRVELFAAANQGVFRHTRFEGNLAEVVAHEIAHFNSVRALGVRAHLALPLWKSEGWAEYQANLSAIRADPEYDLAERIDLLFDDRLWAGGRGAARGLWESQLLVEYLGEVEGLLLEDLARDDVIESSARQRMMAWHGSRHRESGGD